jgi:hypothetical protein
LPLAPEVTVIHAALLLAVQAHPAAVETVELPEPPEADTDALVGLIEYEQLAAGAAWVTVYV